VICFTIPIQTVNESNGSHGHPAVIFRRREGVRHATLAAFMEAGCVRPQLPCSVRLTRISAGELDSDGLRSALKSVRDAVASLLEVDDNAAGERSVAYRYAQERCPRGEWAVRVEFLPYVDEVALLREAHGVIAGLVCTPNEAIASVEWAHANELERRIKTALEVLA
jgi:hypothetical protein